MQKMHIAFFLQFCFLKNIIDMSCYNRLIALKKVYHLCLSKPDRFILHPHLQLDGFVRLV